MPCAERESVQRERCAGTLHAMTTLSMQRRHANWRFMRALVSELASSRLENGAAALAFFSMLAIFPTAIFGLSLLPYLPIPNLQEAVFDLLGDVMPKQAAELLRGTVQNVLSQRHSGLLSFGLLFGVWSATSGVLAVMEQLDVVARIQRPRAALRARAVAFALLFPLSLLATLAFGLLIFGGMVQDWLAEHLIGRSPLLLDVFIGFRWLVVAFALLSAIDMLYRFGPTQACAFRLFSAGSVFATVGMLAACFGLRFYVESFASYDAIYGSLGAVIVLLLWLFVAGWVFLIGAAIDRFLTEHVDDTSHEHANASAVAQTPRDHLPLRHHT